MTVSLSGDSGKFEILKNVLAKGTVEPPHLYKCTTLYKCTLTTDLWCVPCHTKQGLYWTAKTP